MMGDRTKHDRANEILTTGASVFPTPISMDALVQRPEGMPELEDIEDEELMNVEIRDASVMDTPSITNLGAHGTNSIPIQSATVQSGPFVFSSGTSGTNKTPKDSTQQGTQQRYEKQGDKHVRTADPGHNGTRGGETTKPWTRFFKDNRHTEKSTPLEALNRGNGEARMVVD